MSRFTERRARREHEERSRDCPIDEHRMAAQQALTEDAA